MPSRATVRPPCLNNYPIRESPERATDKPSTLFTAPTEPAPGTPVLRIPILDSSTDRLKYCPFRRNAHVCQQCG